MSRLTSPQGLLATTPAFAPLRFAATLALALAASLGAATFSVQAKEPRPVEAGKKRATAAEPAAPEAAAAFLVRRTFADMGAGSDPLRLPTWQAGYTLKIPLSPRERLKSARLKLHTANSTALIRSRSALSVRLGGEVIAQFELDPQDSVRDREIDLPVRLLKPGYNNLDIEVVQHYTYDCEDPASPELWTEIHPQHSSVTMEFEGWRSNVQPRLTQMGIAFDQRAWLRRPLAFAAATDRVSELQLAAAALVAQGVGLRVAPRVPEFQVHSAATAVADKDQGGRLPGLNPALARGKDVVLVGLRSELSRLVDASLHKDMAQGPFVGLYGADGGQAAVLVVSGNTDAELMQAARAVAQPNFKFSDQPSEVIKVSQAFEPAPIAQPLAEASFAQFGFRTQGVRGARVQPIKLEFRAPGDWGAQKGDLARVKLHFSYGAGLQQDSSMVVKLNGQFVVAVALNEAQGAEFQSYELRLPAQAIRPGYNTLVFEPVFRGHKDRCDMFRDEGMVLTLYEDSTLELPVATVAPVAPDLRRLAQGLWPYDSKLPLFLSERDTPTAAAALSLASFWAQRNRAPLDVALSFSPMSGHMLAVGPQSGMPEFMGKALPLGRYSWGAAGGQVAWMQGVDEQRIITAFTAADPSSLSTGLSTQLRKGLWLGMEGQAALLDPEEGALANEPATKTVVFGAISRIPSLRLAADNWQILLASVAAFALASGLAFARILRRRGAQRRQAGG